ncbi:hypothetical protein [Henriciella pelagia]|uniref:hypothetical protein n=1 Tax=Henriciella pelagia TaxID=1977912 RepID=UPI0035165EE4
MTHHTDLAGQIEKPSPEQFGDCTRNQSIQPGDLIAFASRFWQVTGVHLGAVGQEDVATIVACDRTAPDVHGQTVRECVVPIEFICGRVYRYLPPDADTVKGEG